MANSIVAFILLALSRAERISQCVNKYVQSDDVQTMRPLQRDRWFKSDKISDLIARIYIKILKTSFVKKESARIWIMLDCCV